MPLDKETKSLPNKKINSEWILNQLKKNEKDCWKCVSKFTYFFMLYKYILSENIM